MGPSTGVRQHRDAIYRAASPFRAAEPRVFGSVLHGDDCEDSDLDLLMDALPGATLFDLGGLQDELEQSLPTGAGGRADSHLLSDM